MVSAFRRTRGERTAHDMPRCRGLLSDGAASPCRRQRPPPHLSFHFAEQGFCYSLGSVEPNSRKSTCQKLRTSRAEVVTDQFEKPPQTPLPASLPPMAVRSLEKCNSCYEFDFCRNSFWKIRVPSQCSDVLLVVFKFGIGRASTAGPALQPTCRCATVNSNHCAECIPLDCLRTIVLSDIH